MTLEQLLKLSPQKIESDPFPLRVLLKDSLYYPACDIDGELIRYCNLHFPRIKICSFVYADYGTGEERLTENLNSFLGYHLLSSRTLRPEDVGADRPLPMPEGINPEDYQRFQPEWKPFAHWAVLERDEEYGDEHGPERFSLLFLGAEGVAAYEGLYNTNKITPKAIALIQPGHGFGFNWTNFYDWNAPLARTVRKGKSLPEYFFYGGMGYHGYNACPWPGYTQLDRVDHYYPTLLESAMTVWRGNMVKLKVYDGNREDNVGITMQIMDNARTLPHICDRVFLEYQGRRYEATIGAYRCGDTLRGAETIKDLIVRNNWQPGQTFLCEFSSERDGNHIYKIMYN